MPTNVEKALRVKSSEDSDSAAVQPSVEFRQRIIMLIVRYARALAGFLELRSTVGLG